MGYSTPVRQLLVSNIKSMDLNTVTIVPKMVSNVGVCCHCVMNDQLRIKFDRSVLTCL